MSSSSTTSKTTCPTCGTPVEVVQADEGTAHYRALASSTGPDPENSSGVGEAAHSLTMEFDGGGPRLTLHHPEGGCKAPLTCGLCAADLTDPDSKRCYDCEGMESEGCWLQGWFDNLDADELLHGKVTVPFDAEWDLDHPIITIRQPAATQPEPSQETKGERR